MAAYDISGYFSAWFPFRVPAVDGERKERNKERKKKKALDWMEKELAGERNGESGEERREMGNGRGEREEGGWSPYSKEKVLDRERQRGREREREERREKVRGDKLRGDGRSLDSDALTG